MKYTVKITQDIEISLPDNYTLSHKDSSSLVIGDQYYNLNTGRIEMFTSTTKNSPTYVPVSRVITFADLTLGDNFRVLNSFPKYIYRKIYVSTDASYQGYDEKVYIAKPCGDSVKVIKI